MTILLALLIPLFSFAAERSLPVEAIKLPDGKIAYCAKESDVGTVGLYPSLPAVSEVDGEIRLAFGVFGVICVRSEERLVWESRPINAPFFTRALDGELVENFILSSEAVITDQNYMKALASQPLVNRSGQNVNVSFELVDLLSADQQESLRRGEPVAVRVNYFNRAINEYVYRGKRQKGRAMISGAYTFKFKLEQKNGKIEASAVQVF